MTKIQIEVITSVERRRRWTAVEKEQRVAASMEPGAVVSALARDLSEPIVWLAACPGRSTHAVSCGRASRFCGCADRIRYSSCASTPWHDRDRACRRDTDADQRRGWRGDPISGGRGPGDEGSVAMIEVPAAQRVAAGHGLRRDECRGVLQILASASCAARSI